MNVSLGKTWDRYVADQVASGEFNNASEVVRDALRRQQEHFLKLQTLRREIDAGMASLEAGEVASVTADDIVTRARTRRKTA